MPSTVESSLRIIDILKRADCEWVPAPGINRYMQDVTRSMLGTMLYRLSKHDIIESKKGPTGGYRLCKSVSLYEIYRINAPSGVAVLESCFDEVNIIQRRFIKMLKDFVIEP